MNTSPAPTQKRLTLQAILFTVMRMVLNMNTRMVYPFLPVIARGLGVSLTQVSYVLSARSVVGAFSPLFTTLADRRGRRFGMVGGLSLFIASILLLVAHPVYWTFLVSQCGAFLGMFITVSSVQAYLSDNVPYEQRGRLLGLTELGWAFSFILGMPLIGWLISRGGWMAPYPLLAGLAGAALVLIFRMVLATKPAAQLPGGAFANLGRVLTSRPALAALAFSACVVASNEMINLVFGDWMENSFQLSLVALGGASAVIGLADMTGEGLVAAISDRMGKKRAVVGGFMLNALVVLALPWLGRTPAGALAGLFVFYASFEFGVISSMAMFTEIMPAARATLLGAIVAAYSVGRGVGALLAPLAYHYGFRANTLVSLALTLLALLALSQVRIEHAQSNFGATRQNYPHIYSPPRRFPENQKTIHRDWIEYRVK